MRCPSIARLIALVAFSFVATAATADSVSFTRKGASYEDVRLDLESAILKEGLKIDYTGNIGAMLTRTGPDVGSNQPIYQRAEFFTFCSAKPARFARSSQPAAAYPTAPWMTRPRRGMSWRPGLRPRRLATPAWRRRLPGARTERCWRT